MYNLQYTYLTELEVDTRQTFSDISDDLLLVHNENISSTTFDMKTMITCWQDFFWNFDSNSSIKHDLDVTFTDLIIDHSSFQPSKLNPNEMMTYKEFKEFLATLDSNGGKWAGDRTFRELSCAITAALNTLHSKMVNIENLYPVGSMVVSKTSPTFGTWEKQTGYYLAESGIPDVGIGVSPGKVNGRSIGTSLTELKINPQTNGLVPDHEHKAEFIPPSNSKSDTVTQIDSVSEAITCNKNLSKSDKCGARDFGTWPDQYKKPNLLSAMGISDKNAEKQEDYDEDEGAPEFTCESTGVDATVTNVQVAPTTYSLDASVYERNR